MRRLERGTRLCTIDEKLAVGGGCVGWSLCFVVSAMKFRVLSVNRPRTDVAQAFSFDEAKPRSNTMEDSMDKGKYLGLRDSELVIALSRRGVVIAAQGWLPVLVVTAAAVGLGLALL